MNYVGKEGIRETNLDASRQSANIINEWTYIVQRTINQLKTEYCTGKNGGSDFRKRDFNSN